MVTKFTDEKLEAVVKDALTFMYSPAPPVIRDTPRVLAYCSERLSQVPFQLGQALQLGESGESLARDVEENFHFLNGVVGRIAHIPGKTMGSVSYSRFELESGKNYIDMFLDRIGYTCTWK
jgi:hypothetical protein